MVLLYSLIARYVDNYTSLSNLLAVILADGSVDFGARYTVTFTEDPEVVNRLVKEFNHINNITINWTVSPLVNSLRARAYGRSITELFRGLVETTRTRKFETHPRSSAGRTGYPKIRLPDRIRTNPEIAAGFLKYYSTCDGGPEFNVYMNNRGLIQINSHIKVGCQNPYLREELKALFLLNNIRVSERPDGLTISSLQDFQNFKNRIGFLDESKVRRGKLFRGYRKNDVIELMILCRLVSERREWINRNFKQVQELEQFLLSCIKSIKHRRRLVLLFSRIGIELEFKSSPMDLAETSHIT